MAGVLSELVGGQNMAYIEYSKSRNIDFKNKKGDRSKFLERFFRANLPIAMVNR